MTTMITLFLLLVSLFSCSNFSGADAQVIAWQTQMTRPRSLSRGMSRQDRLHSAVHRSVARMKRIEASITGVQSEKTSSTQGVGAPVTHGVNVGEFFVTMGIGTPPRKMIATVDTGSDLTWTHCKPCTGCAAQPNPIFDISGSSTYGKIPCGTSLCNSLSGTTCAPDCQYQILYGDGSSTRGVLSNETFTLWNSSGGAQALPGIPFGCSHDTQGEGFTESDGILGLGRGNLSFINQIGSMVGSRFSYCLTSYNDNDTSETSPLFLGNGTDLGGQGVKSTPMMKNSARPDMDTYYYLSVKGISVGNSLVNIPNGTFNIKSDGSGGFIIDSGTTITLLPPAAFDAVADALTFALGWSRVNIPESNFDLCYQNPSGDSSPTLPNITFHFGGGADYLIEGKYNFAVVDERNEFWCLGMGRLNEQSSAKVPSILGNYQQQNYHILYDNVKQMISFAPAACNKISEPNYDPQKDFKNNSGPDTRHGFPLKLLVWILIFFYSLFFF